MRNKYKFGIVSLLIAVMISCSEEKADRDMGNLINSGDVEISVTPDASDPNLIHFKLLTPDCQAVFECTKLAIKESGIGFSEKILFADTYELKVTVYNKAGYISPVTTTFTVNTTDPTVCINNNFRLLTGGCDVEGGKTWRLDETVNGAIGCGDNGSSTNNWWNAGPDNPAAFADELTFLLNSGQEIRSKTNTGRVGKWSFYEDSYGVTWLEMTNTIPCYGVNDTQVNGKSRYKIFEMTEDVMHITYYESNGTAWHYFFTSKPR